MFKQTSVWEWLSAISTDPNSFSLGHLDLWSVLLKHAVIYQDPVVDKWLWSTGGMILTGPNWSTWRKTCHSAAFSNMNSASCGPTLNPGLLCEMAETNCLGHGTTSNETRKIIKKMTHLCAQSWRTQFICYYWRPVWDPEHILIITVITIGNNQNKRSEIRRETSVNCVKKNGSNW